MQKKNYIINQILVSFFMNTVSYLLILVTFLHIFAEIYETLQNKKSKNTKLYFTKENENLALLRISAFVVFFHDNCFNYYYLYVHYD